MPEPGAVEWYVAHRASDAEIDREWFRRHDAEDARREERCRIHQEFAAAAVDSANTLLGVEEERDALRATLQQAREWLEREHGWFSYHEFAEQANRTRAAVAAIDAVLSPPQAHEGEG